jgi:hypothetical protein
MDKFLLNPGLNHNCEFGHYVYQPVCSHFACFVLTGFGTGVCIELSGVFCTGE